MRVEKLSPKDWKHLSEDVHKVVFEKEKPSDWDRIDYALLAVEDGPRAYLTARELDSKSVYWQFGGAFPGTRGTTGSYLAMKRFLAWSQERYERVSFLVENDNIPMLKMAMNAGFRIVGMRNFKGNILLEHLIDFEGEK